MAVMAKQLWNKGTTVHSRMQELCTGNDPQIDLLLVRPDCIGSAAHARMLGSVGLLKNYEVQKILGVLGEVYQESVRGEFSIAREHEDVHTALELRLTEKLGDIGKKIHTGRSRNDQILLALRLYQRREVLELAAKLAKVGDVVIERFREVGEVPIPGYTHLQPAMPSYVGMWLHAILEGILTLMFGAESLLRRIDSCPLGASAGFGTSLPIDREKTARLLLFGSVQRSPIDVMNSRGWYDLVVVRWCEELGAFLEKCACDLAFGLLRETGFFALDEALCTGSSIMPQKRNPDLVELLRGRASKVRGASLELSMLSAKLPSSYHRDLQGTKEPLIRALQESAIMIEMTELLMSRFKVDRERCEAAMYDELYATYEANRLVVSGVPFRDAYKNAAEKHRAGKVKAAQYKSELAKLWTDTKKLFEAGEVEFRASVARNSEALEELVQLEKGIFSAEIACSA